MIFDTDVLICMERGDTKASKLIEETAEHYVSVQTYMEWLQGAKSRQHAQLIQNFLKEYDFKILPLTENIGYRASVYIEEYASVSGIRAGDAIIAATAVENSLPLATGNTKHFSPIRDLRLHAFRHS